MGGLRGTADGGTDTYRALKALSSILTHADPTVQARTGRRSVDNTPAEATALSPVSAAHAASLICSSPDVSGPSSGNKESPTYQEVGWRDSATEGPARVTLRGPSARFPVSSAGGGVGSRLPKYFTALNFSPGCESNTAFYLQMWFRSQKLSGQRRRGTASRAGWASPRETPGAASELGTRGLEEMVK